MIRRSRPSWIGHPGYVILVMTRQSPVRIIAPNGITITTSNANDLPALWQIHEEPLD